MLLFFDGFDSCGESLDNRWTNTGWSIDILNGRYGTHCASGSPFVTMSHDFKISSSHMIIGFAFNYTAVLNPASYFPICTFMGCTIGYALGDDFAGLMVGGSAEGPGSPIINTTLVSGTWYYCELEVYAGGEATIRLDGSVSVTQPVGESSTSSVVEFGGGGGTDVALLIDDVYVLNAAVGPQTAMLGMCRVETIFPKSAGAKTQWTPVGSVSNYACVNIVEHVDNGPYVYSENTGNTDVYEMDSLPSSPSLGVFGVQVVSRGAIHTEGDDKTLSNMLRVSGTNYQSLNSLEIKTQTYQTFVSIWTSNPATGEPWTGGDVNNAQAGIYDTP